MDESKTSHPQASDQPPELEKSEHTADGTSPSSTLDASPAPSGKNADPVGFESPPPIQMAFIILALVLSIFMVALDMTIVATAIPKITDKFRKVNDVGWYGSAFFLTLASFQSTWGKAFKYFPLKSTFLITMLVFEIGSLICAVAKNSTTLIVGRAIAGAGGAGIASGVYTIIAFSAKPSQRPAFTGLLGASYGVASVVGPLLGGVFTDSNLTWRWCFYINLPIGGLSAVIIFLLFTTPKAATPAKATLKEKLLQMDPIGTFTIMAAAICFLLAVEWGGLTKDWNSSPVIGTFVGFGLLVILFCINEWKQGERAVILGRLLRTRLILVGILFVFFFGGAFFILLYYIPIYFQVISGVSASQSGIRNLALVLAVSISTIVSGVLISQFGHYVPLLIAGAVLATIGSGLLYTLGLNTPSAKWIGYQILAGIGFGFSFQIPVITTQATVAPADLSPATAMVLFFQTIGGAFFVSAAQSAFTNTVIKKLANPPILTRHDVISSGVTDLRITYRDNPNLPLIINGYLDGVHATFAISIAIIGIATVVSFFSQWRRISMPEMGPVG